MVKYFGRLSLLAVGIALIGVLSAGSAKALALGDPLISQLDELRFPQSELSLSLASLPQHFTEQGGFLVPDPTGDELVISADGSGALLLRAKGGMKLLSPGDYLPARFYLPAEDELRGELSVRDGDRLLIRLSRPGVGYLMVRVGASADRLTLTMRSFPLTELLASPSRFPSAPTGAVQTSPYRLELSATPARLPADGESRAEIVARVVDRDGLPVPGVRVLLEQREGFGSLSYQPSLTDRRGEVHAILRAGTTAERNLLVASLPDGTRTELVIPQAITAKLKLRLVSRQEFELIGGITLFRPPNLIEVEVFPEELPADGFSTAEVTARLLSPDGRPLPGVRLSASLVGGSGEIRPLTGYTDQAGEQRFLYVAGREPGRVVIAISDGGGGRATAEISLYEPGAAQIGFVLEGLELPPDKQGFIVDASAAKIELVVVVTDRGGNPVPGVRVAFSLEQGLGTLMVPDPVTDDQGQVKVEFIPAGMEGTETLTAFVEE